MRIKFLIIWIVPIQIISSCASDDAIPISGETDFSFGDTAEKDYMLFTRSGSSANGFVTGFDSLPSGDIDVPSLSTTVAFPAVSGGVSFRNYVVNQQKLFGGPGYERLVLDEEKIPTPAGIIETFGGGSSVAILDERKGYYTDFNSLDIQIFDPQTFDNIGEIDMSQAFIISENDANYYVDLILRGNRMFACLYTGATFPPFVYRSEVGSIVAVIDTDTDSYLGDIFRADTKYPGQPFMRFSNRVVDEGGNIYLATQGGLGLDANTGENTAAAILKIPANREDFDPDYTFQPQLQISESNAETIINSGLLYAGNGIAYTNVLIEQPGTATDLVNLPLMRWAKLDLDNQTAELVQGVPPNAGFTAGMAYNYQGRIFLTVYNATEGINALYETDINTNTGELYLNVTDGGIIYGFYEIDENN
ncbi:MAG: hypothetical protein AAF741_18195 [Bacteroidota bacterium]